MFRKFSRAPLNPVWGGPPLRFGRLKPAQKFANVVDSGCIRISQTTPLGRPYCRCDKRAILRIVNNLRTSVPPPVVYSITPRACRTKVAREPSYLEPWAGDEEWVNNNNRNAENICANVTITRRELTDARSVQKHRCTHGVQIRRSVFSINYGVGRQYM